jgi:hypothetical protein
VFYLVKSRCYLSHIIPNFMPTSAPHSITKCWAMAHQPASPWIVNKRFRFTHNLAKAILLTHLLTIQCHSIWLPFFINALRLVKSSFTFSAISALYLPCSQPLIISPLQCLYLPKNPPPRRLAHYSLLLL